MRSVDEFSNVNKSKLICSNDAGIPLQALSKLTQQASYEQFALQQQLTKTSISLCVHFIQQELANLYDNTLLALEASIGQIC